MKKYIVEFIGTFFLVFTVGLAVRTNAPFAPFAIGPPPQTSQRRVVRP